MKYRADLDLARRCAAGEDKAWERFILEYRPVLYRAADAIDSSGGARELADSLYADLYGIQERDGQRRSLFRYFEGRSSLATWLRAVLAQRYVDRLRAQRRLQPLPYDERELDRSVAIGARTQTAAELPDPDRFRHLTLVQQALGRAISRLGARDRLRLRCYYAQGLSLAETGRLLGEHEATTSRQLARTRRTIRENVERQLRDEHGLSDDQIGRCFESITEDPGPFDLKRLFATDERKEPAPDRSL